MTTLFRSSIWY